MLGTFYYPWYGNEKDSWRHWKEGNHNPPGTWASNFAPDLLGGEEADLETQLYDSDDSQIVKQQLALMNRAGLDFAISSWWGPGDYSDRVFTDVLKISKDEYPSLKWTIYYEKEGYGNVPGQEIASDLRYILETYGQDFAYMKVDGKPVVFVYSNSEDSIDYVQRWGRLRQSIGGIYVVLKVVKGFRQYASLVDSWHQYAPANRFALFEPYSAFVSPGYWKYHESQKLERNLSQFVEAVRQLKDAKVQFRLVETWNEYHEGTMIEPAREITHDDQRPPFKFAEEGYQTAFIDALRS